jgi:two-component system, NtrC family, sensor kinase
MRAAAKGIETENLFKILANKSPVGLYIVQDGKFCYTNPTFQNTTGYTEDELLSMDSLGLVVPEDREQVRENAIKMLRGKLTLPYQFRVTHKNGSIKWIMESVVPIQYRGKRATLGNFTDITERKQTEEALRNSEEKLREIFESVTIGILVTDLEGTITEVNQRVANIHGFSSKDELLGKSAFELLAPRDHKRIAANLKKAIKQGAIRGVEYTLLRADGSEFPGELSTSVLKDASGNLLGHITIVRDITKRKQIEEAVQAERNKLQSLINAMTDALNIVDTDYNLIYQNEPSKRPVGGDHTGEKCYRVFEGSEKVCDGCPVEQAFKDGKSHTTERKTVMSGRVIFWENTANLIRDAEGRIVACLEISKDITERKKQEQALADELTRHRLLIDQSLDGIVVLDVDARVVEANQRFAEMLGYTHEEVYKLHTWDWDKKFPPEKLLEMVRNADENGFHLETQHTRKDGSVIDVDISINAAMFRNQKLIFCVCRDITKRKQIEEATQAEKNKLQSLIDAMEDNLTIRDRDYNLIYMSERAKKTWGDHIGEKCYRVYERQEKVCDGCPVEQAFKDGKSHTAERRVVLPSGEAAIWENTANPIRDAEGRIISCLEVSRNITKRKKTEEALQNSEEKLRIMFESATDAISVIDLKGILTELNQRAVEMHGFSSKDELRGKSALELVAPRDHKRIAATIKKAIKQGAIRGLECTLLKADGSEFPGELSTSVLKDASGNLVGRITIARDITGRKKQEQALKDSEESYRTLANSITDVFFAMDEHLRYTYWNKASEILIGVRAEDALGKSLTEIFPDTPGIRSAEKVYRDVLRTQQSQTFMTHYTDRDGRHYILEISAYPSRGGLSVFVRDITESKRAEEALRQSEERFRSIVENSQAGIMILDDAFRFTYVNDELCRMSGYSPQEIIGQDFRQFLDEESQQRVADRYIRRQRGEKVPPRYEFNFIHKDGQKRRVEISSSVIRDPAGKVKTVAQLLDITERKQAEASLRQSEENYRALFDSSVIGTILLDVETMKVMMANQACVKIFGFSSTEEVLGIDPFFFVLPEDKERYLEIFQKSLLEENSHEGFEIRAATKDGREIWLNATITMITHRGKLTGLASFVDITERKLQSARLMLADRLASLGELAAGTAHELNNPLTSVIGFSQLLMEKDIPDDIREDVKLINNEAQRAAGVTKNLLTFARKHAPVKQLTQINNTIEDVLKLRAYEQKVNSIEVKKQLAHDLPEIMVDYFQMQQVFLNIIINAEYFMAEAHNRGTLTITTKKQNGTVGISFADDGPGIPGKNLSRLFDPFFTTKEAGKGTGLGLSICHGIVTEHGGQIYAKSQPGKGATFVVELPIKSP